MLRWNRASKSESGTTIHTSKCGRYTVERKKFLAPSTSKGYLLRWMTKDGKERQEDMDTVADAK